MSKKSTIYLCRSCIYTYQLYKIHGKKEAKNTKKERKITYTAKSSSKGDLMTLSSEEICWSFVYATPYEMKEQVKQTATTINEVALKINEHH